MNIYHYNQETREYLGAAEATPDPRRVTLGPFDPTESDHYLQPANTTFTPPPEAPVGQKAQWQGNAWTLVDDYRGQTGYRITTGEPVEIKA